MWNLKGKLNFVDTVLRVELWRGARIVMKATYAKGLTR